MDKAIALGPRSSRRGRYGSLAASVKSGTKLPFQLVRLVATSA